ncbi:MAG: hypothetical protein GOMPHAMPRED_002776 [Gomphillus americanus]|uniref:Pre-mRNA-processing factor 17 n=1 Tax=Gomphillus americanus TaxID=1940652 RepID=A0A8H3FEN9_9LECA|nr:MAG: hypothetical protein GOMPHAMPRED_002776 [Gomphillus americanus]
MSLIPRQAPDPSQPAPKRKNVPTGFAEEIALSRTSFTAQHRTYQSLGYAREPATGALIGASNNEVALSGADFTTHRPAKAISEAWRSKRQKKGDASIVSGDGSYKGPWAKYEEQTRYDESMKEVGEELASDEEWVEEEFVAPAGTSAVPALATDYAPAVEGDEGGETTEFHGSQQTDYQGRTYMHVPQDLGIDLTSQNTEIKNYIPSKQIHTWRGHTKPINALRFFPNSGHLLLSSSADTKIKLWDVYHQRELLRTFSGHSKSVNDICFNPTGTQFLSASYDKQIKLWDTEYGKCISRFTTGKIPHVIKFHPPIDEDPLTALSTEFLVGTSDNKIVQFDVRSGDKIQEYDHHLGPINSITFVDENRRFVTTSDDKSLRAWDYGIPVPIKFIAEPYMFALSRAASHPSGKYLAFQSGDNQIVVYAATDRFRQNRKKSFRGHNSAGYAIDLDISPDGQFLASGDSGGYVCFWDWKTGKLYHKFLASEKGAASKGPCTRVAWHPRETSKVVTAGLDGAIRYWD